LVQPNLLPQVAARLHVRHPYLDPSRQVVAGVSARNPIPEVHGGIPAAARASVV